MLFFRCNYVFESSSLFSLRPAVSHNKYMLSFKIQNYRFNWEKKRIEPEAAKEYEEARGNSQGALWGGAEAH